MKSSIGIFIALALLQSAPAPYQLALPAYRYEFPRDHFNHEAFQTEWWYYTGNLKTAEGHRYGFELTFFRQGVDRDARKNKIWDVRDIYLAHLALSDLDGGQFYHEERVNRAGPAIAGARDDEKRIWNGNWQILWAGDDQKLQAANYKFKLDFVMHSEKSPIINGNNGVSQKAAALGQGSHYISLTRLATTGSILLNGNLAQVTGTAWMDHEFFTQQLDAGQTGWDWLSLQLEDKTELMLFRLRRKDGTVDPFSAGTYVDAQGNKTTLKSADFILTPLSGTWTSSATHATYPIRWRIAIPKLALQLESRTLLANQELAGKTKLVPNYWEGAILLSGKRNDRPLTGVGYLEMTGYDRPIQLSE